MSGSLIAKQVRKCRSKRSIHLSDNDFWLCGGSRRSAGDKRFSDANAESTCLFDFIWWGHRVRSKTLTIKTNRCIR